MSADELLKMTEKISSAVTDTQAIRDKIFEQFDAATSSEQRDSLLAMFAATMDIAEGWIAKNGTKKELAEFKEKRADDHTRLLVKESTVAGIVSPVTFMTVTNREIAAGRMTPDDPIRQMALKTAAVIPRPSHTELMAMAEAKQRSDVSIDALVNEMKAAKSLDIVDIRERIYSEFDAAQTSDQRGKLLTLFTAAVNLVERNLASRGDDYAEMLANLQNSRAQDYKLFILKECTVGLDTPVVGGDISVDMLMAVTNREIAAGRMTEDHSMRKTAVERAAAPHLSHAELLAKHAKLKEEAAKSTATPPQTFGMKLKGFLWKYRI
jgi:hypothetical protein